MKSANNAESLLHCSPNLNAQPLPFKALNPVTKVTNTFSRCFRPWEIRAIYKESHLHTFLIVINMKVTKPKRTFENAALSKGTPPTILKPNLSVTEGNL